MSAVSERDGDEQRSHGGTEIVNLLLPSRVPRGYHLHRRDEMEHVAGRPCLLVTANPREPEPAGLAPGSQVFDMVKGGTVFRPRADQKPGADVHVRTRLP